MRAVAFLIYLAVFSVVLTALYREAVETITNVTTALGS